MNVPREDAVPLQEGYYPPGQPIGQPVGQPMGQRMVQYTTVNVDISREMPKDYVVWSLMCFLYSNPCCLGLAALIYSVKARDRKVIGDVEGARRYGTTARTLNIISTVCVCFAGLIALIVIIVVSQQAVHSVHIYSSGKYNNYYGRK